MEETGSSMGTVSLAPQKHLAFQSLAPDSPDSGGQLDTMLELLNTQPTPCRFILQKPKVNTRSRHLLKKTNKYCLAVRKTPVLTLLLDQTAGRTLPVLSEVMNPGIKCKSMDINMQLASSGNSTGGGEGGGDWHWHFRAGLFEGRLTLTQG